MEQHNLADLVKYMRHSTNLTQEELAQKAGVGLRFVRDLEQGKQTIRMDKLNQVLALFGYKVSATSARKQDQWEIIMNHMNRNVRITQKDWTERTGILKGYRMKDQQVLHWEFIPDSNALKYRDTKDETLVEKIDNDNLLNVENLD